MKDDHQIEEAIRIAVESVKAAGDDFRRKTDEVLARFPAGPSIQALEAELAQVRQERDELKSPERLALGNAIVNSLRQRAEAAEAARDHLRARLRELVKKWEAHAPVMIGGNEMIACANQLLAILSELEDEQQTEVVHEEEKEAEGCDVCLEADVRQRDTSAMTSEQAMAELWGLFCPDCGPTDYAGILKCVVDEFDRMQP